MYRVQLVIMCDSCSLHLPSLPPPYRVLRTMFTEGSPVQRLSSPLGRRRLHSSGSRLTHSTSLSSPQLVRKGNKMQPSPQKSKLISSVSLQKKKKSSPEEVERSISTSPEPKLVSPFFEEPRQPIHEQVLQQRIWNLLNYGIHYSNIVLVIYTCTCTQSMQYVCDHLHKKGSYLIFIKSKIKFVF